MPWTLSRLVSLLSWAVVAALILVSLLRLRASRSRDPHTTTRFASLNTPAGSGSGAWWLLLLCTLVPLAASALLLHLRCNVIPARFPIHWGFDGQPNRWADRTVGSVFGLLMTAPLIVLAFGALGEIIARSSPGHAGRPQMIRTTRSILLASAWLLTLLFSAVSLLPLAHDPTSRASAVVLLSSLCSLAIIGFAVFRFQRLGPTLLAAQGSTETRFWRAGFVYYNPADSALLVAQAERLRLHPQLRPPARLDRPRGHPARPAGPSSPLPRQRPSLSVVCARSCAARSR